MKRIKTKFLSCFLIIFLTFPIILTCNSSLTLGIDAKMEADDPFPPGFADDDAKKLTVTPRATAVSLSWTMAVDDLAESDELEYKVVFSSSDNIADVNAAEKYGTTAVDWTAAIDEAEVGGLSILTEYYFNVLVRDKAGNAAAYTMATSRTLTDPDPPVLSGGSGVSISSVNTEDFTVSWAKARDEITPPSALEYRVYCYASDNESETAETIILKGTPAIPWTADIDTQLVSGLLDNVKYHVTVMVRDEVEKESVYTAAADTTVKKQYFYWTDIASDIIQRNNYSGSDMETVVSLGAVDPIGIAIDPAGRKIYWIERVSMKVRCAGFDEGMRNPEDLITQNLGTPEAIAVDYINGYLFWTDTGNHNIYKSPLPPPTTDAADYIFLTNTDDNVFNPEGIDVDMVHQLIYWCEYGVDEPERIRQSDYSGSTATICNLPSGEQPEDLCVLPGATVLSNIVYFVDNQSNTLTSCNMSGTTEDIIIGLTTPWSVALDLDNRILFFLDRGPDLIYRYDLDQSSPTTDPADYDYTFNPGLSLQNIAVY